MIHIEEHPAPEAGNLRRHAEVWMDDHPEVMALFEQFALELVGQGRVFGIGLIAERVRWECVFRYGNDDKWKINNNYRAYIARRLAKRHPSIAYHLRFRRTAY